MKDILHNHYIDCATPQELHRAVRLLYEAGYPCGIFANAEGLIRVWGDEMTHPCLVPSRDLDSTFVATKHDSDYLRGRNPIPGSDENRIRYVLGIEKKEETFYMDLSWETVPTIQIALSYLMGRGKQQCDYGMEETLQIICEGEGVAGIEVRPGTGPNTMDVWYIKPPHDEFKRLIPFSMENVALALDGKYNFGVDLQVGRHEPVFLDKKQGVKYGCTTISRGGVAAICLKLGINVNLRTRNDDEITFDGEEAVIVKGERVTREQVKEIARRLDLIQE